MTINYIDFLPSADTPFQFQAVLDGSQYNATVTYNIFGQRYYLNLYSIDGVLILSAPMVGSPEGYDISIIGNLFTSTLVYRAKNKQIEISDQAIAYPDFGKSPVNLLDAGSNNFVLDQSLLG